MVPRFFCYILMLTGFFLNASTDRPNIIYILADDLGYGDLGCYGQKIIETPNIDRLAKNGMKFTNHYSGSTVCAPSRACLLNGQHTGHVYVRANGDGLQMRQDPADITIARVLKNAGYHTAMIGKSGTGCDTELGQSNRKGFDYFFGFNTHKGAHHYYPPKVYRNSEEVLFPNNHLHHGDTYIHDIFIKEVKGYIEQHQDKPFFLHYAALIPHASLSAPEEWVDKYRGKVDEAAPVKGGHYAACKEPKATFAGMVSRLDWEVGEIMKKLKVLGLDKNTLVMFASDNGPHSAGGNRADWFDSNSELRGEKRDLFEGGVRVPMIAHWPEKIQASSTTDHMSAFWDVMPTLCDLIETECPPTDGISFLPTLLGRSNQKQHDYLYWEFYEKGGKRAALTHRWKAVQLNMSKGGDPIMLFNLDNDLSESKDLAKQYPEVIDQFKMIFDEAHTPSPIKTFTTSRKKNKKK
jgi:arylsulfatase A-like enzyme